MKDLKISKELISEVLNIPKEVIMDIYTDGNYLLIRKINSRVEEYNIYGFAFKCKEWILSKGYSQLSGKDDIYEKDEGFVCSIGSTTLLIKDFYADREIAAIFLACEHILNNIKQQQSPLENIK